MGKILLAIIVVLGFVLKHNFQRNKLPTESKITVSKSSIEAPNRIASPQPSAQLESTARSVRNHNLIILSGVSPLPVVRKKDNITLELSASLEPRRCQLGDFDFMKSAVSDVQMKNFILSIESLDQKDFTGAYTLSLEDMIKSKSYSFKLPLGNGAYGVYLCGAAANGKSCARSAPFADKNTVWQKTARNDKMFYFQLIVVKDDSLYLVPSERWGQQDIDKLRGQVGSWMDLSSKSLERMAALNSKIRSLPLDSAKQQVHIPLPYRDSACDRQVK
ncbi:MAG: hypothetical protein EOP04_05045 [Proteobacteria bacterium]|nr:MAG: hypothetical protein EOP04_05045 [Pseudomonadota bacterium]